MCECLTEVNTSYEPESIQFFQAMQVARFPLNKRTMDAFDAFFKLAKEGNKPSSFVVTSDGTDTIVNDLLIGRTPNVIAIDDIFKMTGFEKAGDTEAERLNSNTLILTEGAPVEGARIYIGF